MAASKTINPKSNIINLPARRLFFNRRKEIDEMRRTLGDRAARVLTITGAPGVGKTALALEIAHREANRTRFPGGVVWLNGFASVRETLKQIGSALALESAAPARVRAHLTEQRCLLVFDGLAASDAALEFINAVASEETKVLIAGEKLGLVGNELVWELSALELPPALAALVALWGATADGRLQTTTDGRPLTVDAGQWTPDTIDTARALADDYARDGENDPALAVLDIARRSAQQIQDRKLEGACLTNIGLIHKNRGDLAKALEYLEQSLALARELGSKQGEADQLGNIGLIHQDRGDPSTGSGQALDKALEYHEQALALARELGYKQGEANQLGNIGLIYRNRGDLDKALEYLEQSLALARELGYKQGEAKQLLNIGNVYYFKSDLERALDHHEQALALARELGYKQNETIALGNIGLIYRDKGHLDKALEYLEQSLALARELGYKQGEASDLGNIGGIYQNRGDLDKALEYHEQALALYRVLGSEQGEATNLGDLGLIHRTKGDLHKALDYQERALALHRKMGHKRGEAVQLGNIGLIYRDKGDLDKALEYQEKALALTRTLGYKQGETDQLGNIGNVYQLRGDLDKALEYLEQSLALARELGYRQGEADQLLAIGNVHYFKGDAERALDYHKRALALAREVGHKQNEVTALGNIGASYFDKDDLDKALESLEQSLSLARELGSKQGEASALSNIGLIYRAKGDPSTGSGQALDKALEYLVSALSIRGITADAQSIIQNNLARIRTEEGEKKFDILLKQVVARLEKRFGALARAAEAEQAERFGDAAQALAQARETYDERRLKTASEWREYARLGLRYALAFKRAGDFLQALDALTATFKEFKKTGDDIALGRVCLEMGHTARSMDSYGDAWIHYTDAYRMFKRAGNKRMMGVAREESGTLEFLFRQPRARADLEEAYQLYSQVGERVRARTVEQMLREAQATYAAQLSSQEKKG